MTIANASDQMRSPKHPTQILKEKCCVTSQIMSSNEEYKKILRGGVRAEQFVPQRNPANKQTKKKIAESGQKKKKYTKEIGNMLHDLTLGKKYSHHEKLANTPLPHPPKL